MVASSAPTTRRLRRLRTRHPARNHRVRQRPVPVSRDGAFGFSCRDSTAARCASGRCDNRRVTTEDQPLHLLLKLLDIERLEDTLFRGLSPDTAVQRVFGGQVAGQALVAGGRTVDPERRVHSLHAYFLHAGDPAVPLIYSVDVTRDTRTMSTRRVTALQHGRAVFVPTASFMVTEDGVQHQD